jgi:hypothetical protein
MALARMRTIPTERPLLVGKVVPTFVDREMSCSQHGGSPTAVILVF